jgi:OmpA-OmpF porin, OOP family
LWHINLYKNFFLFTTYGDFCMKLSSLALSSLAAILLLAGCATQSSTPTPAAAPAAPATATSPAPTATAAKSSQPTVAPAPKKVSLTSAVYFDKAQSVLNKKAKAEIDDLLGKLKDTKLEVIVVVGHTDNKGSASANQKLGMRRANAVKSYLMTKGIAANQIYTDSKIDSSAARKAKEGGATSRRAEIEAIGYRSN